MGHAMGQDFLFMERRIEYLVAATAVLASALIIYRRLSANPSGETKSTTQDSPQSRRDYSRMDIKVSKLLIHPIKVVLLSRFAPSTDFNLSLKLL